MTERYCQYLQCERVKLPLTEIKSIRLGEYEDYLLVF